MQTEIFHLSSYSLFLWIAVILVESGIYLQSRKSKFSVSGSILLTLVIFLSAFIGARQFHVVLNSPVYTADPTLTYSLSFQGLSVYGAILLVSLLFYLFQQNKRLDVWKFSDGVVPCLGLGIAIARVGCFLNGCCFGIASSLPWAVRFPLFSPAHLSQLRQDQTNLLVSQSVHPTQLYEAIGVLVGIFLARKVKLKMNRSGVSTLTFLAFYSLLRLGLHYIRDFSVSSSEAVLFLPILYLLISVICLINLFPKLFPLSHQR